eukprot:gene30476-34374_t
MGPVVEAGQPGVGAPWDGDTAVRGWLGAALGRYMAGLTAAGYDALEILAEASDGE